MLVLVGATGLVDHLVLNKCHCSIIVHVIVQVRSIIFFQVHILRHEFPT